MITGFLSLLADRYGPQLDDRGREFIAYSVEGAGRMSQLIRDLLEYSRVDRRAEELQPVEASRVLEGAIGNLRAMIEDSGATVTHDDLPTVMGDRSQLLQVFQNLIGNAIKFRHPDRPPRIHVSARSIDGWWEFSVRDNGIGIPPEQHERVFVIFQRLHTRDKYPGSGIGLALVKRIIERHGGRVWVESIPGEGTNFLFTLPGVGR